METVQMETLQAIGVSKGGAIGKSFWLRKETGSDHGKKEQADKEDLNGIIEKIKGILHQMEKQTAETLGGSEAAIFAIHQMILDDKFLIEHLKELQKQGFSLRDSVVRGFQTMAGQFRDLEDEYMKERAADFENLGKLMIDVIDGNYGEMNFSENTVLLTEELYPTDIFYLQRDEVVAVAAAKGGANGHAAILARSLGIPAVLGVGDSLFTIQNGEDVILDGKEGILYIRPDEKTKLAYEMGEKEQKRLIEKMNAFKSRSACFADGTRYLVLGNAGKVADAELAADFQLDGLGLFRTEYLYQNRDKLPSEEEQLAYYRDVLSKVGDRPVTFRTFDIGGDKPVRQLTLEKESNPFLGLRGIRLALYHEQVLRTQLRALLRASAYGQMEIMFPFICSRDEVVKAKNLVKKVMEELEREGRSIKKNIPVGIMVEIPSIAIQIDAVIRECDFVSIGTNDLVQYTLGIDRTNPYVAELYREEDPSILQLIAKVAAAGKRHNIPVSVCGEMAGNPRYTKFFTGVGVSKLSMTPSLSCEVKEKLNSFTIDEAKAFADKLVQCHSAEQITILLEIEG